MALDHQKRFCLWPHILIQQLLHYTLTSYFLLDLHQFDFRRYVNHYPLVYIRKENPRVGGHEKCSEIFAGYVKDGEDQLSI